MPTNPSQWPAISSLMLAHASRMLGNVRWMTHTVPRGDSTANPLAFAWNVFISLEATPTPVERGAPPPATPPSQKCTHFFKVWLFR